MNGRVAGLVALVTCALLATLALPASAPAKRGMVTGFAGLEQYQTGPASERPTWFNRTADANASMVRLSVGWAGVAGPVRPPDPTNPGSASYDFSTIDGPVRDARARGLSVMLTVNVAPTWAEGPNRPADAAEGSWEPSPSDLADFLQAVAARYSGGFDPDGAGPTPALPSVQAIEVWDEPNSGDWLTPQFTGKYFAGADHYRLMLNAAYKAIKSINPAMDVIAAGTDPYGDPPGGPYPASGARARPVEFWQHVFCVKPVKAKKKKKSKKPPKVKYVRTAGCSSSVSFDIFAHHPIDNTGGGPLRSSPNRFDASTPDLGRVVSVLRGAEKVGTASGGHHPVWVTEFWWDSKPPNPVGAPLKTQARWMEQSLYLFWKAGASLAVNFEIADSSARPDVRAGQQSGVYFQDGRPKPSLQAMQFPFVTERVNKRTLRVWGRSPRRGKLLIQRKQGGWRTVKKMKVGAGSVFVTKLRLSGKQQLRAVVAGQRSLVWKQAAAVTQSGSGGGGPSGFVIALIGLAVVAAALAAVLLARRRTRPRSGGGVTAIFAKG
ncbi:MAG: hypothetical protein WB771_04525 [Solirubrobacterales bacterium]